MGAGAPSASSGGTGPGTGSGPRTSSRAGGRREPPPNLRDQVRTTVDAAKGVVDAHVALAKAEAEGIKYEVGRAAGLGAFAIACLILLAFFLPIGLLLFLGEWVFGSMGWGIAYGTEVLVTLAVLMALLALRVRGLAWDLLGALLIGLVVALVFGLNLPHTLWSAIGDALNLGDRAWRPLAVAVVVVGGIGGLIGLVAGAKSGGAQPAVLGLVGGFLAGALFGAITAIAFHTQGAAAVGLFIALAAWPALMGVRVARQGIDTEALKARFIPQVTIETTKETLEWTKSRIPFGPKP